MMNKLSTEDRISRAKIHLHRQTPFFSYLVEHLRIREAKENEMMMPTMGVDAKGNCLYTKEFVDKLSTEHLTFVLAHEVMHVALEHPKRMGERNIIISTKDGMISLWNIAIDIIVNNLLISNNFSLLENVITPDNNQVTVFDHVVNNISEKSSEDIYEELKAILKQMVKDGKIQEMQHQGSGECDNADQNSQNGNGQAGNSNAKGTQYDVGGNNPGQFDNHLKNGGGQNQNDSCVEGKDKDWKKIVAEAYNHSKIIGREPAGFERMFENLHKHKLNWRTLLKRTISSKIPYDMTYARPNKKYLNQDIYMPSIIGESIKVICAIDTSGSISHQDLGDFVSEMIGISRSFSQVDFRVLTHDTDVHDDIKIYNGSIDKIKQIKIHGGGGTSHIPLYEYIRDNNMVRETKLLVCFTDGYSCFPDKRPDVETIFVLSGGHIPAENMPNWAITVCLD